MATTAAEVLIKAKDLHPDAITLDLLIPGAEGWNTLRDLRQTPETARIPVLVVSVMDESKAIYGWGRRLLGKAGRP